MFKHKKNPDTIMFTESLPLFAASVRRVWRMDRKYILFSDFVYLLGTVPPLLTAYITAVFNKRLIAG